MKSEMLMSVRSAAVIFLACGIMVGDVHAETYYYDANGATPGFGTALGVWGTCWTADETGSVTPISLETSFSDVLWFGKPLLTLGQGTINVDASQKMGSAHVVMDEDSVLTFAGSGDISLPAAGSVSVCKGSQVVFATPVSAAGSLTLDVAAEEFVHYADVRGKLLSDTADVVVARNADINQYVPVEAIFNKAGRTGLQISGTAGLYNIVRDESAKTLSVQIQSYVDWTKCVKVRFSQQGADIVARIVYARYYYNSGKGGDVRGRNFDTTGGGVESSTVAKLKDNDDMAYSGGYNVDWIRLSKVSSSPACIDFADAFSIGGSLALGQGLCASFRNPTGFVTLDQQITGLGNVAFSCAASPSPASAGTTGLLSDKVWTKIADGVPFASVTNVMGMMSGQCQHIRLTARYRHLSADSVTFQVQQIDGDWLKCIYVECKNDENDALVVSTPKAGFLPAASYPNGVDFDVAKGVQSIDIATAETGVKGYCLKDATFDLGPALTVRAQCAGALPSGATDVYGDLVCLASGSSWDSGAFNAGATVRVHGGRLIQKANFIFGGNDGTSAVVDHGTFLVGQHRTSVQEANLYLNGLTLTNASFLSGPMVRVGFDRNPVWHAAGTGRSVVEAGMMLVGETSASKILAWTIDVAETDDAEDVDLLFDAEVKPFTDLSYKHIRVRKTGAGTLRVQKRFDCAWLSKPLSLEDGTFELGANNVFAAGQSIALVGGTLAAANGTTNAVGVVTLEQDSVVRVGENSVLSFAAVKDTAWTPGATLTVQATNRKRVLRFGTSASDIAPEQLASLVMPGCTAVVDTDGYVSFRKDGGILLIFR